ncbi:hypothetical protein [Flavobacterium sp.]|uniref:hypothetical protein n=1 Tax=Flavobacterium sp. TaxID=239 RepID=UPI003D6B80E4
MCAFNDTIIRNTLNLSDDGENYFYIYIKLKKLIDNNKNIKNVFMSFTNNQINNSYDSTTIWSKKYINFRYPKYALNFDFGESCILLKNNPATFLKAQQRVLKNNVRFVCKNNSSIIENGYWGGFKYLKRDKTDSLIKVFKKVKPLVKMKYPKVTLDYLDKIIKLCEDNKINLYLLRCPMHKLADLDNDYFFKKIVQSRYSNITFLDFKNFPLENDFYADFSHLNHKGSTKFSLFFEKLLKNGLLSQKEKQAFIDKEMDKISSSVLSN